MQYHHLLLQLILNGLIFIQDDEQYIGQVAADGSVIIWRCSDGASIPVDYANVPGTLKATYLDNTAVVR